MHLNANCKAHTAEVLLSTVVRAVELTSFTIHLNTNTLNNYNFSSLNEIEFEKQGHINLQEVGSKVPLLPIANSTFQKRRTMEILSDQNDKIRLYENLLLGIAIGLASAIGILILFKCRSRLWTFLFTRNKSIQTEVELLEKALPKIKNRAKSMMWFSISILHFYLYSKLSFY